MSTALWFESARRDGRLVVEETPKFDLELVETNYSGRPKIERLLHIGRTSTVLGLDALAEAVKAAKDGLDEELYKEVARVFTQVAPEDPRAALDSEWLEEVSRKNSRETSRLEAELKGYKNNLLKESIRMAYDDAGQHNHLIGNLKEAERAFSREREFCQTPAHVAIMMSRLIGVYVDRKAWIGVENSANKLRDLIRDSPDPGPQDAVLSAIIGLARLSSKHFSTAAESFIETNPAMIQASAQPGSHGDSAALHRIISASDVATYGALCAMASMDRDQLKTRVLENTNFRQFLEREPHLRRIVSFFVGGKFSQCLSLLESYRADYLLDVNLAPHFKDIFERVRRKAVVQYLEPFSCITIGALAAPFNLEEDDMVALVIDLINSNSLQRRLDMASRTVVQNKTDLRIAAHEDAIRTADAFTATLQQRCLRLEAVLAGMEVQAPMQQERTADTLMGQQPSRTMEALRRTNLA